MNRDVGFWDTGEFQTVPYILGLAHSNGFPTEILAGWVFTHVVPFDSPAQRMTDLSVLYGAASAALCFGIARRLGADRVVAALAALCFATNAIEWQHATRTDVIDPAVALGAASIFAAMKKTASSASAAASGLFAGAALGTHAVAIFYLPAAFLWLVVMTDRGRMKFGAVWLGVAIASAAALYSYILVRSLYVESHGLDPAWALGTGFDTPIWNWGEPDTVQRLWGVMSGDTVGGGSSLSSAYLPGSLLANAKTMLAQARGIESLAAIVLLALGVGFALCKRPKAAAILLVPAVLVAPFAASFVAESDAERYYLLPDLLAWSLLAAAVRQLVAASRGVRWSRGTIGAAVVLLAVAALNVERSRLLFQQPADRLASNYIAAVLRETPSDSVIIAPWVYATPLTYESYVEHATGARTIVFGELARTADAESGIWDSKRPVFVISEQPPATNDRCVQAYEFGINPDRAHDPRLFRCTQD